MSKEINQLYRNIAEDVMTNGEYIAGTKELNNYVVKLENPNNAVATIRSLPLSYLCGELVWYWSGNNDIEFISLFSNFWKHISDDGQTNNSAYGYLIHKAHGFDQLDLVVELLKKDPNSRRAVININYPNINRNRITTKDEQCTLSLQFLVRDNKVLMTTIMRSNDLYFGFSFDVPYFTSLQKYVAESLGLEMGTYTHFATSMHIYERDFSKFDKVIDKQVEDSPYSFDVVKLRSQAGELYELLKESDQPKKDVVREFKERGILLEA